MPSKWAYYNDTDSFACEWLRELMKDGLIAQGDIDCRSIAEVQPDDVKPFRQVHLFAGIGVWSAAARLVGIPDDRPLWTASCPCPPFSSAGPNFRCPECDTRSPVPNAVRTGAFDCIRCGHEWQADERHLFPELFRLVRECRPERVAGEQVASADGRTWLDVVSASLEMLGYAVGSPDTCAAGFGAPHIRQRLYWVADADSGQRQRITDGEGSERDGQAAGRHQGNCIAQSGGDTGGVGHPQLPRLEGHGRSGDEPLPQGWQGTQGHGSETGQPSWLADAHGILTGQAGSLQSSWQQRQSSGDGSDVQADNRTGPTNGLWTPCDWLSCTDGKWRPTQSSSQSMADAGELGRLLADGSGASGSFYHPLAKAGTFKNRVQELRGAGNALNLAQAAGFLRALMDVGS